MAPVRALVAGTLLLALTGCAGAEQASETASETVVETDPAPSDSTPTPSMTPSPSASATPSPSPSPSPSATTPPRPEPKRAFMSIPALGVRDFPVVRYRGSPDDRPGTELQNAGEMASPRGARGGVGPGEVGNYIVTGHRTSHNAPLADLPDLDDGARVRVRSGDEVFVYRVVDTRETSFRSAASLARQRAAVPGRPGATPTQAMLTLSTCATPEDHAEGNYWADEFGNPEHRIDKIAVLVSGG